MIEYVEGIGSIAAWDQIHQDALVRLRHARAFILVALPADNETPQFTAASHDLSPEGMRVLLAATANQSLGALIEADEEEAAA